MYNDGKKKTCCQSPTEDRQQSNPYYPLSYREYCDMVIIGAYELNEMVHGIPVLMIADMWLINSSFRGCFKRLVKAAAFIHYETVIQQMMPWCYVDLVEFAKRFQEEKYSIEKKYSPCTIQGAPK